MKASDLFYLGFMFLALPLLLTHYYVEFQDTGTIGSKYNDLGIDDIFFIILGVVTYFAIAFLINRRYTLIRKTKREVKNE